MLFLRRDQAMQLLNVCRERIATAKNRYQKTMAQRDLLVIRYFVFNGLSPMELAAARIEHLDPVECTLFLPRRHWKRNCLTDIDTETVQLTIIYCGSRKKGPLVRSRYGGHFTPKGVLRVVKRVALRTMIPNKERVSALILKRTFAREWLLAHGTVGSLQKQFSHKHLWSTAHYLRFVLEDVKVNHKRMVRRIEAESVRQIS